MDKVDELFELTEEDLELANRRTLSDKEAKAIGVPLGTMVRKNMGSMSKKIKDNVNLLKRLSKNDNIVD